MARAESRLTRGQFLRVAGGAAAAMFVPPEGAGAAAQKPAQTFVSRPDLQPPTVSVSGGAAAAADGYAFLGPTGKAGVQAGAMIVDPAGRLVYFDPVPAGQWVTNVRLQQYRGSPVITWWAGKVNDATGYGHGSGVVLDNRYRPLAHVRAGNGRSIDLHEFLLTAQGTALFTCYPEVVDADLSRLGGPSNGRVRESIIQEVDVATGHVLLEWRSLDHVPVSESYYPLGGIYDYLHVNSIDVTPDGHLLLSARHTCALYKVHRRSGKIMWRLGGRNSDFGMGPGTRFAWQHDARSYPGGRITLFDDGAGPRKTEPQSRGVTLDLDHVRRRVSLGAVFRHPRPLLAYAMGNMQLLSDGNVVVGWGNVPTLSQFGSDGSLVMDLALPWGHATYRAFRFPWSATPTRVPALAARPAGPGSRTLYASWNGSTGVSSWRVSAGPMPSQLSAVATVPSTGFETVIPLAASGGYAAVSALGASGQALATSAAVGL
ncbi:MAG TPA: arylsulfotransferase family protein [Solirubrobacteraceae bacterium]|nr:arylsulfotransferase family protein [Solirubrobacteraceae bacterium]